MGLAPFSINNNTNKKKPLTFTLSAVGTLYNYILSFTIVLIYYYGATIINENILQKIDHNDNILIEVIDMALISTGNIACVLTLWTYATSQHTSVIIANQLLHVDKEFIRKISSHQQNDKWHWLIYLAYIMLIIILYTVGVIMHLHVVDYTWVTISNYFTSFMLTCCIIQYAFVLLYLQQQFATLTKSLGMHVKTTVAYQQYYLIEKNISKTTKRDIQLTRESHRILYEQTIAITNFYSFIITIITIYCFISLTFHSYTCMINMTKGLTQLINECCMLLINFIPIVLLTSTVTKLHSEVCIIQL